MKVSSEHLRRGAEAILKVLESTEVRSVQDLSGLGKRIQDLREYDFTERSGHAPQQGKGCTLDMGISFMEQGNCYTLNFGVINVNLEAIKSGKPREVLMVRFYNGKDPDSAEFTGEIMARHQYKGLDKYEPLGKDVFKNKIQIRSISPNTATGIVDEVRSYLDELVELDRTEALS